MSIEQYGPERVDALGRFVGDLGPGDLAIIKEPIADPDTRSGWAADGSERRWVVVEGEDVVGFGALVPLPGWSSHVGEIRVVTHPQHRRKGIGGALAQHLLARAIESGLAKVMVEVVSGDEGTQALFEGLGFRPEALLADQIRDRDGNSRDLILLAHDVDEVRSLVETMGAADSL